MKLKLARNKLKTRPKTIELEKIEAQISNDKYFYFDSDNSHKELKEMVEYFEKKSYSVYMREIRYGLDDGEYIYEVHFVA